MSEYLFSYGTLQKERTQIALFGRALQGSADILRGYGIATIEITDQAFLSKGEEKIQRTLILTNDKNDTIKGTALEVTREELLIANKYEPDNYKRIKVQLESGKDAWIYVAIEPA
ncbi:MAG: gamma-glutamylcyclotransferase [Chitinophagaceae bacterium]|nr:gamma-glutamylcyclotransferase [Chitinophagaceae bacterium]